MNKDPASLEEACEWMKIHEQNYDIMFASMKKTIKAVSFEDVSDREELYVRRTTIQMTEIKCHLKKESQL